MPVRSLLDKPMLPRAQQKQKDSAYDDFHTIWFGATKAKTSVEVSGTAQDPDRRKSMDLI